MVIITCIVNNVDRVSHKSFSTNHNYMDAGRITLVIDVASNVDYDELPLSAMVITIKL